MGQLSLPTGGLIRDKWFSSREGCVPNQTREISDYGSKSIKFMSTMINTEYCTLLNWHSSTKGCVPNHTGEINDSYSNQPLKPASLITWSYPSNLSYEIDSLSINECNKTK